MKLNSPLPSCNVGLDYILKNHQNTENIFGIIKNEYIARFYKSKFLNKHRYVDGRKKNKRKIYTYITCIIAK